MKIIRNLTTKENKAFWNQIERSAREVCSWPDWKRAGINVERENDMKKVFEDDNSYIEITPGKSSETVIVSLGAKDSSKKDQIIMVSVEINKEELLEMLK